jgi:hypothetical protein
MSFRHNGLFMRGVGLWVANTLAPQTRAIIAPSSPHNSSRVHGANTLVIGVPTLHVCTSRMRCCGAYRRDKEEELRAVICFLFTDARLRWGKLPNSTSAALRAQW